VTHTPDVGRLLGLIVLVLFAWEGLSLVRNPKEWLERYDRSTADQHIRATRLIGGFFLAIAFVGLLQMIGQLWW